MQTVRVFDGSPDGTASLAARLAGLTLCLAAALSGSVPRRGAGEPVPPGWQEDFSHGMANWWVEGGERAWVEDGRLHLWADAPGHAVATAWCRRPLPAEFELELTARVASSTIGANNINLFLCYADPSGRPLEETRDRRSSAAYRLYHGLNGYIVTFLNANGQARVRLRRNPGFVLLAERQAGECREGVTYRLHVLKQHGELIFSVDGREFARTKDPQPWSGGLLGLRTFRTRLWWDDVQVRALPDPPYTQGGSARYQTRNGNPKSEGGGNKTDVEPWARGRLARTNRVAGRRPALPEPARRLCSACNLSPSLIANATRRPRPPGFHVTIPV